MQPTPDYGINWYRSDKYKSETGEVMTLPKGQRFSIGPHTESSATIAVRLHVGNFFLNGRTYSQTFAIEPNRVADQIEEAKRSVVQFYHDSAALKKELQEIRKQRF